MNTMNDTSTHIAEVDAATIKVGDLVEQAGVTYRVTRIKGSDQFFGIQAVYYVWTGSEESDTFRSVVNRQGAVGQIRWEMPYRKPDALLQPVTHPMERTCTQCNRPGSWHGMTGPKAKAQVMYCFDELRPHGTRLGGQLIGKSKSPSFTAEDVALMRAALGEFKVVA